MDREGETFGCGWLACAVLGAMGVAVIKLIAEHINAGMGCFARERF